MTDKAPLTTVFLPLAYALHVVEEWFGDFPAWTLIALGNEVSVDRFLLVNGIAFPLFVAAAAAAVLVPRLAWLAVVLATIFGVNGVLHAIATIGIGLYSPGVLSGLIFYVPLAAHVLWSSSSRLSTALFAASVAAGVAVHAVIAYLAFL